MRNILVRAVAGTSYNLDKGEMDMWFHTKCLVLCIVILSSIAIPGIREAALAQSTDKDKGVAGTCEIRIGGDGKTWTYSGYVNDENIEIKLPKVQTSDFIRSTSGPCVFHVFNSANYEGRYVTLGTGLDKKIRAGIGGIDGAGDTWRIRSIIIWRINGNYSDYKNGNYCKMRIGGNGVRMNYYIVYGKALSLRQVPAMNRISYIQGGSICKAFLYNETGYNGKNKAKNNFNGPTYDPKFRVRSFDLQGYY